MAQAMDRGRLEAFSDGVLAVAITLLVLDLHVDASEGHPSLGHQLRLLWPQISAYVVSFLVIGVIWVNHHALCLLIGTVDRTLLFVNLVLLLFVTTLPFTTSVLADFISDGGADARWAAGALRRFEHRHGLRLHRDAAPHGEPEPAVVPGAAGCRHPSGAAIRAGQRLVSAISAARCRLAAPGVDLDWWPCGVLRVRAHADPAEQPAQRSHPVRKLRRTSRVGLSTFVSTRQIDCQVPSCSSPPSTGTSSDGG